MRVVSARDSQTFGVSMCRIVRLTLVLVEINGSQVKLEEWCGNRFTVTTLPLRVALVHFSGTACYHKIKHCLMVLKAFVEISTTRLGISYLSNVIARGLCGNS